MDELLARVANDGDGIVIEVEVVELQAEMRQVRVSFEDLFEVLVGEAAELRQHDPLQVGTDVHELQERFGIFVLVGVDVGVDVGDDQLAQVFVSQLVADHQNVLGSTKNGEEIQQNRLEVREVFEYSPDDVDGAIDELDVLQPPEVLTHLDENLIRDVPLGVQQRQLLEVDASHHAQLQQLSGVVRAVRVHSELLQPRQILQLRENVARNLIDEHLQRLKVLQLAQRREDLVVDPGDGKVEVAQLRLLADHHSEVDAGADLDVLERNF